MTPPKSRPLRTLPQRLIFPLLYLAAGLALPLRCEGDLIGFEETGTMVEPRAYHTATLLLNGKVLVTSGSSAELYDPANETWTATGGFMFGRGQHTATLLPNGKVLVAGGIGITAFNDVAIAELYDPASGTWTPTGSLNYARRSHTATLLPDGKVLVAGGFVDVPFTMTGGASIDTAELWDPASGTWTITGKLTNVRRYHTATLLPSGKVLVAGGNGYPYGAGAPKSAELYDPASGTWTSTGNLTDGREYHTATLLPNGQVLVAGGFGSVGSLYTIWASAELYDPASETWSPTGSLATAHAGHTATLLQTGKVLVAGGSGGGVFGGTRAELYDPSSGAWMATGSLLNGRRDHSATLLLDGNVLVAGGSLATAELYGKSVPTLLNISTRMHVQTGDKVLIAGFIITGTEPKTVIVRGVGPSLPMAGTLADPVIDVHGPSGELLATNDNWKDAATRQEISDSGFAPSHDLESALWGIINPGAYTVILTGKDGGTGVGSIEVYDLDHAADSRLANISTRGFVDTGDNVMIGGLIVGGGSPTGTANVVVRALGPTIPVTDALANPTVDLHDENGATIAFNDDWKTRPDGTSQQAEIIATGVPPTNGRESAFVRRLLPGNYTAIVRGKDNTAGIGLVEVYHLP